MPVHQEGVIAAVGGQEQEAGGNQEDPAERVTGLAPGDQDPDTRARNADHYRHDPVAELTGQQRQRQHGDQGQHGEGTEHRQPDDRPGHRQTASPDAASCGTSSRGRSYLHGGDATPSAFRDRYRTQVPRPVQKNIENLFARRRAELGQPEGSRLAAVIARDLRAPGNRRVRGLGGEFFVLVLGLAV